MHLNEECAHAILRKFDEVQQNIEILISESHSNLPKNKIHFVNNRNSLNAWKNIEDINLVSVCTKFDSARLNASPKGLQDQFRHKTS